MVCRDAFAVVVTVAGIRASRCAGEGADSIVASRALTERSVMAMLLA